MSNDIIQSKLLKIKKILEDSSNDFVSSLNDIIIATNASNDSNASVNMIVSESDDDEETNTETNTEINTDNLKKLISVSEDNIDTEQLLNKYESYSDTNTNMNLEISQNYEITETNPQNIQKDIQKNIQKNIQNIKKDISDKTESYRSNNLVVNLANSDGSLSSSSKKKYKFSS